MDAYIERRAEEKAVDKAKSLFGGGGSAPAKTSSSGGLSGLENELPAGLMDKVGKF